MIQYIKGNLLFHTELDVIGHQTNCVGVMGAGIAKQVKARWPKVFEHYKEACETKNCLGKTQLVKVNDSLYIANIFGEYCPGKPAEDCGPNEHRDTDYIALHDALEALKHKMEKYELTTLGLPCRLGCGLAGGDWEGVVKPMIEDIFSHSTIDVLIVDYDG